MRQQQEQAQAAGNQGGGQAVSPGPSRTPRRPAQEHKLVAPERGQKPPAPPMRGAKGNAQDALGFFMGGFRKG